MWPHYDAQPQLQKQKETEETGCLQGPVRRWTSATSCFLPAQLTGNLEGGGMKKVPGTMNQSLVETEKRCWNGVVEKYPRTQWMSQNVTVR